VGRIPGVGKVTEARMAKAGIKTVGDTLPVPRNYIDEFACCAAGPGVIWERLDV
jgi:nucleotidyltransferase/DNA polymerase involved in DNA repair